MMDQLQARALGCYGAATVQTPHLDALAASGTLFERFFVTQALCVPSRCSLFTGRYVHAHRHRNNMSFLRPDEQHLGSLLRAAGYRTGYSGKNHLLPRGRGEQDFDYWRGSDNQEEGAAWRESASRTGLDPTPPAGTPDDPWPTAFYVGSTSAPAAEHADARRTDAALAFLDQVAAAPDGRPFALIASYSGPHTPFAAPSEFYGRHPRGAVPIPPAPPGVMEGKPAHIAAYRRFYRYDEMTDDDRREIIGTYHDFVTFLDAEVGRLLRRLDAPGLRRDTLIVFTADHGEFAGELGLFEKHAPSFYDCLVHVPLIVSWPGAIPAGARRADLAEQVDVLPTILEYCGVEVPGDVQGLSARRVVAGEAPGQKDAVFAESCAPAQPHRRRFSYGGRTGTIYWYRTQFTKDLPVEGPGKMIRTADWKLCRRPSGMDELYDLRADPLEHTNLAGRAEYRDVQQELEGRLFAWMVRSEDPRD